MDTSTTPRFTARALAVLLWIAGSSYLIRNELGMPNPDWVVICTMPLIWAAVIALPILAHHAWKQSEYTAFVLLSVAAVVGSMFTLQGTISRQSEARDVKVAEAQASNFTRAELVSELDRAKKRYEDANRYADAARGDRRCGPQCRDWELRAKEVKAHIDQLTSSIASLGADKPVASGEKRVAAAIGMLPFVTASQAKIEEAVALFNPSLFGLFLELAALASAFFGWRPMSATSSAKSAIQVSTSAKPLTTHDVTHGRDGASDLSDVGRGDPALAGVTDTELQRLRRYFSEQADESIDPEPAPTKPRRSRRSSKKETGLMKLRARTLAGERPPLKVIMGRHRVSRATACRWRQEAMRSTLN